MAVRPYSPNEADHPWDRSQSPVTPSEIERLNGEVLRLQKLVQERECLIEKLRTQHEQITLQKSEFGALQTTQTITVNGLSGLLKDVQFETLRVAEDSLGENVNPLGVAEEAKKALISISKKLSELQANQSSLKQAITRREAETEELQEKQQKADRLVEQINIVTKLLERQVEVPKLLSEFEEEVGKIAEAMKDNDFRFEEIMKQIQTTKEMPFLPEFLYLINTFSSIEQGDMVAGDDPASYKAHREAIEKQWLNARIRLYNLEQDAKLKKDEIETVNKTRKMTQDHKNILLDIVKNRRDFKADLPQGLDPSTGKSPLFTLKANYEEQVKKFDILLTTWGLLNVQTSQITTSYDAIKTSLSSDCEKEIARLPDHLAAETKKAWTLAQERYKKRADKQKAVLAEAWVEFNQLSLSTTAFHLDWAFKAVNDGGFVKRSLFTIKEWVTWSSGPHQTKVATLKITASREEIQKQTEEIERALVELQKHAQDAMA